VQSPDKILEAEDLIDRSGIGRLQILVAVLSTLVIFIDGFNIQVMAYITPQLAEVWQIPHAMLGPIFSSGLAGVLAGYLLLSPLSGMIGHRRMLICCTAVFGVLTLLTTTAGNAYALIVLRVADVNRRRFDAIDVAGPCFNGIRVRSATAQGRIDPLGTRLWDRARIESFALMKRLSPYFAKAGSRNPVAPPRLLLMSKRLRYVGNPKKLGGRNDQSSA
jgi:hypothetical protein